MGTVPLPADTPLDDATTAALVPVPDNVPLDTPSPGYGAQDMFMRGMTLGGSDYLDAAERYAFNNAPTAAAQLFNTLTNRKGDHQDYTTYNDELSGVRKDVADYRESDPMKSYGSEIAGGVVSPIFGEISKGVGSLTANWPKYFNLAAQNAAGGAAAGIGNAQDKSGGVPSLMDVGANALGGAATGAVLGTAVPATTQIGGSLMGGLKNAVRSIGDQFTAPETAFGRRLALAAQRDGITADQIAAKLSELGPESTIADTGPNLLGLARVSAQMPGPSLTAATDLVANRTSGQGDRITQAALDAAGVHHIDEAIANRSVMSRPAWDAALNQGQSSMPGALTTNSVQITSPTIQRLLTRPDIQSGIQTGIKYALDEAAITGEPVQLQDYALQRNPDSGQFEINGTPTMRLLEAARRGMASNLQGDAYHNAQTGRLNEAGFHLNGLLQTLTNQMDDLSATDPSSGLPLTQIARQTWGGPSQTIEALAHIQKVADSTRDTSDMTGRLFGSQAARDKIAGLFPDEASQQNFAQVIQNEKTMANTNRMLTGGSQTAYLTAAKADAEQPTAMDAMESLNRNPAWENWIYQGLRGVKNMFTTPPQSIADQATPLFSRDPAVQKAALAAMTQRMKAPSIMGMTGPLTPSLMGGNVPATTAALYRKPLESWLPRL